MRKQGFAAFAEALALLGALTMAVPLLGALAVKNLGPGKEPAAPAESGPAAAAQSAAGTPQPAAQETSVVLWDEGEKKTLTLPMHEYLVGAVASEMPQSYGDEALKAQTVATRSYCEYCRAHGTFELEGHAVLAVNTRRREGYMPPEVRAEVWGVHAEENTARLEALVGQVENDLLLFDGETADACYYASSAGTTAAAADVWGREVPYLVQVDSHWDEQAPGWRQTLTFTYQQMYDVLAARFVGPDLSGDPSGWFGAAESDSTGYVKTIGVGGAQVSGTDLRTALGLRSACFVLRVQDGVFVVETRGYGHGVGMSQFGASVLAAQGGNYEKILAYYYPGTTLRKGTAA